MDFTFDDYESEPEKSEVIHNIKLKNQNGKVFYDKLTYIYLEMPNFSLSEAELKTRLDQWLFFIKHLEDFQRIPVIFNDSIFSSAFEKAEIAKFGLQEMDNYQTSLKVYRDLKGVIDTAFDEGKEEGIKEGMKEGVEIRNMQIAKNLLQLGLSLSDISKATGLSVDDLEKLR